MPRLKRSILIPLALSLACAHAQQSPPIWQPAAGHEQMSIWPGAVPDAMPAPKPETTNPDGGAFNVSRPTMTVYAPAAPNTGVAMLVFPGGGYQALAMRGEGSDICEWLTSR